jgi:RNA polymerase primary sigma factor
MKRGKIVVDKNLFIETLHDVAEVARTSPEPLSKEEIRMYFGDMELSDEQEEMIYQYLKLPEEVRNAVPGSENTETEGQNTESESEDTDSESAYTDFEREEETQKTQYAQDADSEDLSENQNTKKEPETDIPVEKLSDSVYYRMYLDEVKGKTVATDEQQIALYQKLLDQDSSVVEQIVDNWLMRIIEIAKVYQSSQVNAEDLIQEGNMALWMALGELPENMKAEHVELYLVGIVKEAMEAYIREITGDTDRTQAVLAKAALLHEATALLAKENGQEPSIRQLSEYTHMSTEEIEDILAITRPAPDTSADQ